MPSAVHEANVSLFKNILEILITFLRKIFMKITFDHF